MSDTDTPNLDELEQLLLTALRLVQKPEPGLFIWHKMLGDTLKRIAEFVTKEKED